MAFKYNHGLRHHTNSRVGRETVNPNGFRQTKHHVPPRTPDSEPRIIIKDERHHRAYHLLLGNPSTFKDACYILWRDWWGKKDEAMPTVRGRQPF